MKIHLGYGYIKFHCKDQLAMGAGYPVKLACHWHAYEWMAKYVDVVSKRLFVIY